MDVRIILVLFADGIVCNVNELMVEVIRISNAVFVMAAMPDFSCGLLAGGERISAFDVLDALCC